MGATTGIEWTHTRHADGTVTPGSSWNPVRGCSRVSKGCERCYAESVAHRFGGPGQPYEGLTVLGANGPRWNGEVRFIEEHLADPLRWNRPRKVFVNSMSDLFHENIPDEWIDKIFAVMALAPRHTFQILTKRPERMCEYLATAEREETIAATMDQPGWIELPRGKAFPRRPMAWPLPNVWLGVSAEDQKTADERIPLLLSTPAAIRFISAEPLLGLIDLSVALSNSLMRSPKGDWWAHHGAPRQLHWVIVGGESGRGARPMHPDWARSLRDQCIAANVPYFFKQWGEWAPVRPDHGDARLFYIHRGDGASRLTAGGWWWGDCLGEPMLRVGKKAASNLLDGREWNEMPESILSAYDLNRLDDYNAFLQQERG